MYVLSVCVSGAACCYSECCVLCSLKFVDVGV